MEQGNLLKPIVENERGTVVLIALMTLALMTIIGVSAISMSTSEALSVRNIGIHKQNLHLVESAVLEGLQRIMDMEFDGDISDLDPQKTTQDWIYDDEAWEKTTEKKWSSATSNGPVLNADNSTVPEGIIKGTEAENIILFQRGELDEENLSGASLRYTLIGWNTAHRCTLKATTSARRSGRLLAEYVSDNYGILRLEIGLERKF
jgi:hypothetical protein